MPSPGGSATVKDSGGIPSPQFWDSVAGAYSYLYGDTASGTLYTSGPHIVPANSGGYKANQLVKSSAGIFFGVYGQYKGASNIWVMVFDAAGTPSNGSTPLASTAVPISSGGLDVNWFISAGVPYKFSNGLYISISSTGGTFTQSVSTDISFTTEYL
jgi:hypothetical protein